jgi:hypothetical protein
MFIRLQSQGRWRFKLLWSASGLIIFDSGCICGNHTISIDIVVFCSVGHCFLAQEGFSLRWFSKGDFSFLVFRALNLLFKDWWVSFGCLGVDLQLLGIVGAVGFLWLFLIFLTLIFVRFLCLNRRLSFYFKLLGETIRWTSLNRWISGSSLPILFFHYLKLGLSFL